MRRDLQLLKMRSVLDPKRHYKKENSKNDIPAYSQVGTIIEGPTEFYSSRIAKRDRRQTIMEEVIAQEKSSGRFPAEVHCYFNNESQRQEGLLQSPAGKEKQGQECQALTVLFGNQQSRSIEPRQPGSSLY